MPSRRNFLRSAAGAAVSVTAAPRSAPNVVLIITDDQGYGDLACHGNPVLRTPNLDALHARSIRLTDYHVSPTCAPTRSALLTGRYTNSTGAWHTIMGRSLLHPEEVTLADCFRAAGYRTGIFGKWHLGDNHPCRPQDRGFDEVLIHGGGGVWQTPDYFGNDYADDTYFHNGKPESFKGYCTDVWFGNAMKFMDDSVLRRRPFFCYISTNAPHGPMWAQDRDAEPYQTTKGLKEPGFFGMIANIDENAGRLVRFLRERKLEENTILIFTTDNGTSSGAAVFNAGMRAAKGSPYDGGHRVPFFIHWPAGKLIGPRNIGTLTAHIDILPTLVDLCGLSRRSGPELHGKSLRPLLYEKNPVWPDRAIVTDSQRLDNLVRWRQAAVMTQQWRLVNSSPDGDPARLELYDMRQDPGQKRNIAAQHPEVVQRLKSEYDKWWALTSGRANDYVRISLGSDAENPVRLVCHDWHGEGSNETWNQAGIRKAPAVNGFWTVNVLAAGEYRFELRRWPRELDLPINAPFRDPAPNRERTPGRAISAVKARLKIGTQDTSVGVKDGEKAAVFTLKLDRGPAEVQTWLYDRDGSERGAYYVHVERLAGRRS